MKIGELAACTGVSIRSLRYYDQQGLLSPVRGENGYREYSPLARGDRGTNTSVAKHQVESG